MYQKSMNWIGKETRDTYVLLFPVLLFFLLFQYYPILKSIVISFSEYGLLRRTTPFIGLDNYIRQFHDPLFLSALNNTLVFVFFTVGIGVVLALVIAVLIEQTGRWAWLYRIVYFIPVVTSLLAATMVWRWMYASNGLLNFLLSIVNQAPQAWLLSEHLALASLMALTIWKNLGFDMVLFAAALQAIPKSLYEASSIDGASGWQNFTSIMIPQIRPILVLVFITAIIRSFQIFAIVLAMTQGGPVNATRTIVYHIYEQGIQYDEMGYASAGAVILLIIVGAMTLIQLRMGRER